MHRRHDLSKSVRYLGSYLAACVGTIAGAALLWFATEHYLQWSLELIFPPTEPRSRGAGALPVIVFVSTYALVVMFAGTVVGLSLGCWLGLRLLHYDHAAQTALVLVALSPLSAILFLAVSDLIEVPRLRLVGQGALLAVAAIAARIIALSVMGSSRRTPG